MQYQLSPRYFWSIWIGPLVAIVLAFGLILFGLDYFYTSSNSATIVTNSFFDPASQVPVTIFVVVIMGGVLLLSAIVAYLIYSHYGYELTDEGFNKQFGIINIRTTSIPYTQIQNVDLVENLWLRLFGLAAVNIQTAGGSSYAPASAEGVLPGLNRRDAQELRDELMAKVDGQA